MKTWNIYHEDADSDEPRKLLGTVRAYTMSDALKVASGIYEIEEYDLIAEQQ